MPKASHHEQDADSLHDCIAALVDGFGRGGLTHIASRLGTTPSNLRKRLNSPEGAFDAITMRAVLLVLRSKSDHPAPGGVRVGNYSIERTPEGPRWSPAE